MCARELSRLEIQSEERVVVSPSSDIPVTGRVDKPSDAGRVEEEAESGGEPVLGSVKET
jgi:hypothetical protein